MSAINLLPLDISSIILWASTATYISSQTVIRQPFQFFTAAVIIVIKHTHRHTHTPISVHVNMQGNVPTDRPWEESGRSWYLDSLWFVWTPHSHTLSHSHPLTHTLNHTHTHTPILFLTHERDKKEAINLTFNKTPSQKIYSDYAKRKKTLLFSKWTCVKKLHARFSHYQERHAEMLYYQDSKYAKPSGKETDWG